MRPLGLASGRIHHWIKKAFHCIKLAKANRKFYHKFNIELHGPDDDCKLMARYNTKREALGLVEFERNVSRLRDYSNCVMDVQTFQLFMLLQYENLSIWLHFYDTCNEIYILMFMYENFSPKICFF